MKKVKMTPYRFTLSEAEKEKLLGLLKNKQANIWQPNDKDILFGLVKELRKVRTKRGRKVIDSVLCLVETFEGETGFWLSTVLAKKFEELHISLGDKVAVQFLGKPKGKNYINYNVAKI